MDEILKHANYGNCMIAFLEKYGEKILIMDKLKKSKVITDAMYALKMMNVNEIKFQIYQKFIYIDLISI